ncbi:MAG TPA: ATP phosphoribosyltransferase regulatory subunit [Thermomicrobiaceae bacterium]|nr:ATP phosphoribosyltransferase regulatory subunit [Thermomicrobiaceae bacterium]
MEKPSPRPRDARAAIDRLRGMVDVDPAVLRARGDALRRLQDTFSAHGYAAVETPVVEPTELFLRKSGGERVAQMYAFHYHDRDIALRPEHTASVLRLYADTLQSAPLPLRLSYAGPVFRYEKPQAGRTRQFTEVGCELLGAAGPMADAEVIHLALAGLQALGVRGRLVLGHIGVVLDFLNRLPLRQRARDWLVWSMERLRKGQAVDVQAELAGLVTGDSLSTLLTEMGDSLRDVPSDQLRHWVLAVLAEVGVRTEGGTRTPEEIVSGVIAKMSRPSDADEVSRAFSFVRELVQLRGAPSETLPLLHELTIAHGLDESPLRRIEEVLALLEGYGHPSDQIELDFGLGRGLHYYTGILFEIHAPGRSGQQLCGGGRYDDLAQTLGARQPLPACGFSYGLERLVEAAALSSSVPPPDVLVVARDEQAAVAAVRVAEERRARGESVELDVRGRSIQASRRYAERRGIARLVVVGEGGAVDEEPLAHGLESDQPPVEVSGDR